MTRYTYRTKDGNDFFTFTVEQQEHSLVAFIESMPTFEERRTDLYLTHRVYDPATGRYYIDSPCRVGSQRQMKLVMQYWAENIQQYIRTGKTFEQWQPVEQDI